MKKATLSIALFSLVVLTSFTTVQDTGDDTGGNGGTPTTTSDRTADSGNPGGSGSTIGNLGGNKKNDLINPPLPVKMDYNNSNGQILNFGKKSDN